MNFAYSKKYLISKPFLFTVAVIGSIFMQFTTQSSTAQVAEETLEKDDLAIDSSLPWGVKRWPYSKVIEVLDLAESVYGRIVIDRYGIDESDAPIKQPFSRTKPGKLVFASLWGSDLDGCYVETIVQAAPKNNIEPEATLPTLLELAIDGQIIELIPRITNPEIISYRYSYLDGKNAQQRGVWHMNHRIFNIDSAQASRLINAPVEDIKARFYFGSTKTIAFTIGADTVERWQDVYSFNTSCEYVP